MSYLEEVAAASEFRRLAIGQHCLALIAQRYEYAGELVEDANVVYLQVADTQWLRFFFDSGYFFCRVEPKLTLAEFAEDEMRFTGVDLATQHNLVGRRIEAAEFTELPDGAELRLEFERGATLVLRNAADHSTVTIKTPVAELAVAPDRRDVQGSHRD